MADVTTITQVTTGPDVPAPAGLSEDTPEEPYHVFVLQTDYGHYIGQARRVDSLLLQHRLNRVPSTAGGNPSLIWTSLPMEDPSAAAALQHRLTALRDTQSTGYRHTVGFNPVPFRPKPLPTTRARTAFLITTAAIAAFGLLATILVIL